MPRVADSIVPRDLRDFAASAALVVVLDIRSCRVEGGSARPTLPQSARHERAKFSLSRLRNSDSASCDLWGVGWRELDRPHPWGAVVAPDVIEHPYVSLDSQ